MTTANKITILRILLVPFFVVQVLYYLRTGNELHRLLGLLAFGVAAISDGIDGYLARHYNQRSELGAILDPLADKLLLVAGIILLSLHNEPHLPSVPMWLTAIIVSRDVLLLLGLVVIQFVAGKVHVKPHLTGKVATVLQMTVVLWALFKWNEPWLWFICLGAGAFTAASGLLYVLDGMRQLSAHPSAHATNAARRQDLNPP